jgi:hypothetical protein
MLRAEGISLWLGAHDDAMHRVGCSGRLRWRMRLPSLSILWLLLLTTAHGGARAAEPDGAGSASAPRVQRMVVTDFEIDAGMAPRSARLVADNLVVELRKLAGFSVVGMSEVRAMLAAEGDRQSMGCREGASCLAELADALGADVLITGRLGRLQGQTVLSMRRIDQARAMVVGEVEERLVDAGGEELLAAVGPAVERLFPEVPLRSGQIRGVPREKARLLNPPPLPVWSTVSVAASAGVLGGIGVVAGLLAVSTVADAQQIVDGSASAPVSGSVVVLRQQDADAQALTANISLAAAAGVAVTAGVMALFTDWGGAGTEVP